MADKPARALVIYGDGLMPAVGPQHKHLHELAASGSCGFLALRSLPPSGPTLSLSCVHGHTYMHTHTIVPINPDLSGSGEQILTSREPQGLGEKDNETTSHLTTRIISVSYPSFPLFGHES